MYARTIVLEFAKHGRKGPEAAGAQDDGMVRVARRTLMCEGAAFDWWAVGDRPALVTVRSPLHGSLNGFTESDPEAFAMSLAKQLVESPQTGARAAADDRRAQSPLEKPGWFEK